MSDYDDKAQRLEDILLAIADMHEEPAEALVALQSATARLAVHVGASRDNVISATVAILDAAIEDAASRKAAAS